MKYLLVTLFLSLTSIVTVNAQTSTPTAEQKQAINPIIDDGFTRWSADWSYDTYVGRSAKITRITIDEDYGDIFVSGFFTYKRFLSSSDGTFTGKINGSGRLVNLTYTDANGARGSKNF